jgi:hypothetical protein
VLLGGSGAASPRAGRRLLGLAAAFSFLSTRRTREFAASVFANHAFGFLCHVSLFSTPYGDFFTDHYVFWPLNEDDPFR